jgi:hypothetical protein
MLEITYGIINYEGNLRNFVFDDWILSILPTGIKSQEENYRSFLNQSTTTEFFYGVKTLIATTLDNYEIQFNVDDYPMENNGTILFKVNSAIFVNDREHIDKILHFRLSGDVVDAFYPPYNAFKMKVDNDSERITGFTLNATPVISSEIVVPYKRIGDIKIRFSANVKNNPRTKAPLTVTSKMHVDLSEPLSFEGFIEILLDLKIFFSFINYNQSVSFNEIEILEKNEGIMEKCGFALIKVFENNKDKELKSTLVDFFDFDSTNKDLAKLIETLLQDGLNLRFIASDVEQRNHYSQSRFIEVIAAYEKNFKTCFVDYRISKKYIDAIGEIVKFIDNKVLDSSLKNEERKAYESIKKNFDFFSPLNSRISYPYSKIEFKEIVKVIFNDKVKKDKEIFQRINTIRNKLAHGETNIEFEKGDFLRFKFMVICVYYLIFAKAGLSKDSTKNMIAKISRKI